MASPRRWVAPVGAFALGVLAPIEQRAAYATVYLSVEEAQGLLFPGRKLEPLAITLSADQERAIERASGVRVRSRELRVWRVSGGGYFIVDEVLGKHEFIPFALGLDASGGVVGVEILEYRETYGDEIRNPAWRAQFAGRTGASLPRFGDDVRNISGATLSCRHVSDGIRRWLVTHDLVLRGR